MAHSMQYSLPLAFNRYLATTLLKQLSARIRLHFDEDTYVIRTEQSYIAYRTWMKIIPLIEVFHPGHEAELVLWLERFGYEFESEAFEPWLSHALGHQVVILT